MTSDQKTTGKPSAQARNAPTLRSTTPTDHPERFRSDAEVLRDPAFRKQFPYLWAGLADERRRNEQRRRKARQLREARRKARTNKVVPFPRNDDESQTS
jgi:hypothetical protein